MPYPDAIFYLRKRYFVCFWAFFGYVLLYILRSNLSIAIVEMTSKQNITLENGTVVEAAVSHDWNSREKGFIISLFSYGFYLSPIGGILTVKYGGVRIFGLGIAGTALFSALSPFLLRLHFLYFAAARVIEGMFESFSVASFLNIFVYWAPPKERSRLVNIGFLGGYTGIFLNYSICGLMTYKLGIDAVFTVTGGVALAWSTIGLFLISSNPTTDKFITEIEKNYFKNFIITSSDTKIIHSWRNVLSSKSAWALFNEYFCVSWSFSFVGACLPLYVNDVFNVNIQTIGYISSIPILANVIGIIFWSFIADYIRSNKLICIPILHRIFITIGHLSCIIFLIIIGLWTNFTESIVCFSLMRFLGGAAEVSYPVIFMDMFNGHAALVRGLSAVFSNTGMLLNPTVMGFLVFDHSRSSWNLYFLFLSTFNIFSLIIYYMYGSRRLQEIEWSDSKSKEEFKRVENSEQFLAKRFDS